MSFKIFSNNNYLLQYILVILISLFVVSTINLYLNPSNLNLGDSNFTNGDLDYGVNVSNGSNIFNNIDEIIPCDVGTSCDDYIIFQNALINSDILLCGEIVNINYRDICYQNYIDVSELKLTDCNVVNETLKNVCLDKTLINLFIKYSDLNELCSTRLDKFECFNKNSYSLILNYEYNNFECFDLENDDKISDCETIIFALNEQRYNSNYYNYCPNLNNLEFKEICSTSFERNII
jgi:hypothetical protein